MSFDREALARAVAQHGQVARISIARTAGSVPREAGTAMLVWNGGQEGSIGGGALEYEATRRAFHPQACLCMALGPDLGQCCGGHATLIRELFAPQDLARIPETGLYVRRVEGRAEKPTAIRHAELALQQGRAPGFLFEQGWVAEPVATLRVPLWIWGAGHVGRALVSVMADLPDFAITWLDIGPERYPEDLPSTVTQLPAAKLPELVRHAPPQAHHLIVTYAHHLDLDLCHRLLGHGFASAGLIGSATKWARFRNRLAALGHSPDQIATITCPIGDPQLGKHPKAIAIGVAAQLMKDRDRARQGEIAL